MKPKNNFDPGTNRKNPKKDLYDEMLQQISERIREHDIIAKELARYLLDEMRTSGKPTRMDRDARSGFTKEGRKAIYKETIKAARDIVKMFSGLGVKLPKHSLEFLQELVSNPFLILRGINLNNKFGKDHMNRLTGAVYRVTSDEIFINSEVVDTFARLRFVLTHEILHALSTKPLFENDPELRTLKEPTGLTSGFGVKFNEAVTEYFNFTVLHSKGMDITKAESGYMLEVVVLMNIFESLSKILKANLNEITKLFAVAYLNSDPSIIDELFVNVFTNQNVSNEDIFKLANNLSKLGVDPRPYLDMRFMTKNNN